MDSLTDIIEDIDWFEEECQAEDYTDTGKAWALLHLIRSRLQTHLGIAPTEPEE